MRCIIIEDQPPAQRILQKYIEDLGTLDLCGSFSDALSAMNFLKSNEIDLLFLDIHLPRLSGIDFLKALNKPPAVILTTAFSDYALEGYDLDVVDYLLKPFSFARFIKAVSRVSVGLQGVANGPHRNTNESEIFIKSGYEHIRVSVEDILLIRSDADYTELVTPEKKYLSNDSLKSWLERLDGFVQVHKSFLINPRRIRKVAGNQIYLEGNQVAPIGRAFKEDFMKSFLQ